MKGIDISAYQSNLDFSKVDADIIIIKATEGLTYTNPLLKTQYEKSKAKGCKVGFYHFLRSNNPLDEAKHFLKAIEELQSDCKYIIDIETDPVGASLRVKQFADYLKSQGKEPAIYTGLCFYNDNLDKTVKDLPLWVAAYTNTRPIVKSVGWQYSEKETIGGQVVDMNIFDEGILLTKKVEPVIKIETSKKSYCMKFQQFYNEVTQTKAPIAEDGFYGPATSKAMEIMNKLIKGEY